MIQDRLIRIIGFVYWKDTIIGIFECKGFFLKQILYKYFFPISFNDADNIILSSANFRVDLNTWLGIKAKILRLPPQYIRPVTTSSSLQCYFSDINIPDFTWLYLLSLYHYSISFKKKWVVECLDYLCGITIERYKDRRLHEDKIKVVL